MLVPGSARKSSEGLIVHDVLEAGALSPKHCRHTDMAALSADIYMMKHTMKEACFVCVAPLEGEAPSERRA